MSIIASIITTGVLGGALGLGLAYASKKFAVETDPRVEQLVEALPGANCGGCGRAGCQQFAEALAKGEADVTGCPVASAEQRAQLAKILGVEANDANRMIAQVQCHVGTRKPLLGQNTMVFKPAVQLKLSAVASRVVSMVVWDLAIVFSPVPLMRSTWEKTDCRWWTPWPAPGAATVSRPVPAASSTWSVTKTRPCPV